MLEEFTIQRSTLAIPSPTTAEVWYKVAFLCGTYTYIIVSSLTCETVYGVCVCVCVCVCVFVTAVCSFPSLQFDSGSSSRPQWFSPVDTTKCELMGNFSTVQCTHMQHTAMKLLACAFEHVFMLICMSWTGLCTHPYASLRIFSIPCDLHVTCM